MQQQFQPSGFQPTEFVPKTFLQTLALWVLRNYSLDQAERDKYGLGAPRRWYQLNYVEIIVLSVVFFLVWYAFAHAGFASIDPLTTNTLPAALQTTITNAKQFLLMGTALALSLVIIRGGMFFIAGLARSIMAAAG